MLAALKPRTGRGVVSRRNRLDREETVVSDRGETREAGRKEIEEDEEEGSVRSHTRMGRRPKEKSCEMGRNLPKGDR